jgi:capsular exopolysaccharide synthesis family protein
MVPTREEVPQIVRYSSPTGRGADGGGRAPGSPSGGSSLTFKDFMRMIRRRIWLILICFVLFTGAAVGGTYLWLSKAPQYTAEALLVVNPPKASVLAGIRQETLSDVMERYQRSQAQSAMTPQVMEDVIQNENVRRTTWFREVEEDEDVNPIDVLLEEVSVGPVPQTNFIHVVMQGYKPGEVAAIVNAVAEAAVENAETAQQGSLQDTIEQLEGSLSTIRTEREDIADRIKQKTEQGAGSTIQSYRTLQMRMEFLLSQMSDVNMQLVQAAQALQSLNGLTEEELANLPEVKQVLDYDFMLRNLEQRVMGLEIELEAAKSKFGPKHKMVKEFRNRLELAEKMYENERDTLIQDTVNGLVTMRQQFVSTAEAQFTQLQDEIRGTDTNLKAVEATMTQLERWREEVQMLEQRITQLQTRLMDLRLLYKGEAPLAIHRQAKKPNIPSFPKYIHMIPLGVFLGLVVGFGLALLLELMDTSIKAPADVSRKVELPVLGMVPHMDDIEEDIGDIRLVCQSSIDTLVDEAFRQIRTTLMFSAPPEQRRSILITSPMPEDGRTAVALNLAHAIASGGKRVLLVDANFRQPAIRALFPQCPEGGLSNVLVGQGDWRNMIEEVAPNMYVMASGPVPPNPSELLGSDQMRECIAEFCEEFDQVIFDSPPSLVVSDAQALSGLVDGTVLVVRAGVNTYGIVQRTRDQLSKLGTHIFGVVLNGVRARAGGYYRKSYETFYEYGETPRLPGRKARASEEAKQLAASETE